MATVAASSCLKIASNSSFQASYLPPSTSSISLQWTSRASPFIAHKILTASPSPFPSPRPFLPLAMASSSSKTFHGQCFVVPDNIDTDQIIPAEHLTLVPSKPEEYEKLGSLAMIGLPAIYGRFVDEGETKSKYSVVIAGANFGCGSSREHAPVALGASGVRAVVAASYARIFFRNSVATGELYPVESETVLSKECKTGDYVTVDLEANVLINHTQNKQYALKPIGDAGPVIDAGGIFAYARKTGMIAASTA